MPMKKSPMRHLFLGYLFTLLIAMGSLEAQAEGSIQLPEIGDPSGSVMTPAQEQRLGQAFMRSIQKEMDVIADPLQTEYIQSLGERLASHSTHAGHSFKFFLIDDPMVNAFAGPAGHIGIFTGLVLATETESELASVLAHEISHVSQRHLARTFDEASRMSLPLAAMVLAAILIGTAGDSHELAEAATLGVQAGLIQHQINFTRANEKEADSIGMQILSGANFDPRAMPVFFERMGRATRFYGTELPEFLRTHPVTTNRIADARGRAENYPYKQHPEDVRYHLLRAALKEKQFEAPEEAVEFFKKSLAEGRYRNMSGQRYGYVLALIRAGDYATARRELNILLKASPSQSAYILANAQLYQKSGRPRQALKTLESALNILPGSYPLSISYAETLLELAKPARAIRVLRDMLGKHPHDAKLYSLLAQAAGEAGKENHAHEYLAEYYYLTGSLDAAVQHLQIALQDRKIEVFRSARMAAKLKQIREELTELKRKKAKR